MPNMSLLSAFSIFAVFLHLLQLITVWFTLCGLHAHWNECDRYELDRFAFHFNLNSIFLRIFCCCCRLREQRSQNSLIIFRKCCHLHHVLFQHSIALLIRKHANWAINVNCECYVWGNWKPYFIANMNDQAQGNWITTVYRLWKCFFLFSSCYFAHTGSMYLRRCR